MRDLRLQPFDALAEHRLRFLVMADLHLQNRDFLLLPADDFAVGGKARRVEALRYTEVECFELLDQHRQPAHQRFLGIRFP